MTLREQITRPPLAAKRTTMKAIVQDRYGSADVLEFRDIEEPAVGDDDVLVRVHAAGCGPDVWHLMTGMPYMARLAIGLRKPKLPVLGWDVAGTVDAVGANVTAFQPGDEVMGTTKGSFAELAIAKADDLVPKPASLTFEEAGSLPISGITALRAIRDEGNVQPGQTVLVIGAAGGVGSLVVQIAKAYGAKVTAVCSTSKEDLVSSIGADDVIDHTREDFADGNQRCTNARKHSGGTLATVRVDYRPNVLEIEVIDVERVLRSRTAKGSRVDPRTVSPEAHRSLGPPISVGSVVGKDVTFGNDPHRKEVHC